MKKFFRLQSAPVVALWYRLKVFYFSNNHLKMEFKYFEQMLSFRNSDGGNYFHEACRAGSILLLQRAELFITEENERVRSLLHVHDYTGSQCIHVTVKEHVGAEATAVIRTLIYMGIDINGREHLAGETALHLAVGKKDHHLVEWLCKQPNINIDAVNYGKKTPYQVARANRDRKTMRILKRYGANTDVPPDSSDEEEPD